MCAGKGFSFSSVLQKNLLPLSSRKALTIPKGQFVNPRCSEGKIKFFIYCSYMCLPLNIQNWGFYFSVISISNFKRLMTCRTKLCFSFVFLCEYLVCDLHNFNKNMSFITSNLRFQFHVTECVISCYLKHF